MYRSVCCTKGHAVTWVQFPMVSLEFFIDFIFPAALRPWGRLRLKQKYPGGEGGRCERPITYHLTVSTICLLGNSGPVQAYTGIALSFMFFTDNKIYT
jgi:hypothetical protein